MKPRLTTSIFTLTTLISVCLLLTSGCGVTINASVPAAPALQAQPQNAPRVNLAAVSDARGTVKAGAIGAVSFDLKSGLNEYVQNSFANGLTHAGYAVSSVTGQLSQQGVKTVVVTVQSASLASFDALLQPARGQVGIAVQVFGVSPTPLYARSYSGTYSETVGVHGQTGYEEDAGRIIATAADQAVSNALADQSFQAVIRVAPTSTQAGMNPSQGKIHVAL